jgi:hypothetical protein
MLDAWNGGLAEGLPKAALSPVAHSDDPTLAFVPRAYAEESGYLQSAYSTLKAGASMAGSGLKTGASLTWSAVKGVYHAGVTTTGTTLDTVGAITKSTFDTGFGIANGVSIRDTLGTIKENFVQVGKNYNNGTSGQKILTDASGYLDSAEEAGKNLAEGGVEKVLGKGYTSWIAGHIGKMTVNMFTGFGKGIYKVANSGSTKGEVAEGLLDIGLSFIGGSKVIAEGSQVFRGGKDLVKNFGQKGLNFVKNMAASSEMKDLKTVSAEILTSAKLTPSQIETLISNAAKIEADEALQAELKAVSKGLNDEFVQLIKDGGSTFWKNASEGSASAYKDFVKETFENSLKGYKDALTKVLGNDAEAYINNLVASKADDLMKGIAKDYIDKGLIPGMVDNDGTYTGGIATGKVTIPVKITVANDAITGGIDWSTSDQGVTATLKFTCTGVVDEKSGLTASCPGGLHMSGGKDTLSATGTVKLACTIKEGTCQTAIAGTLHVSGTFWGESLNKDAPVEGISVTLRKQ